MSWFRKEEKVHFERDASGKVVNVERSGDVSGSRTPISDELMKQQPNSRESRREQRRLEREAYRESYRKARLESARKRGKQSGSMTASQKFDRVAKKVSIQPYSTRGNYNPWGSMFDKGMTPMRKPKSSSTKYTVIGGKAYPIAGGKKKKSKKKTRKTNTGIGSFDMMDNWGFMK